MILERRLMQLRPSAQETAGEALRSRGSALTSRRRLSAVRGSLSTWLFGSRFGSRFGSLRAPRFGSLLSSLTSVLVCCVSTTARAECVSDGALSPCVPANALWTRAGASRWVGLPDPHLLTPLGTSYSVTGEYQYQPLILVAPSPDPDGREIQLVRHRVTTTLGVRIGITHRLEAGLSVPLITYQSGAGTRGVSDRAADGVPAQALADPRLESRYRVLADADLGSLDAGLSLSFPLGNSSAHAREPSVVAAPELIWQIELGRFSLGVGATGRLRREVTLGTASYGNQIGATVATEVTLVERWLSVGVEAWTLTGLVAHDTADAAAGRASHIDRPAEWLLNVRSSPADGLGLSLGGGTAIPLSTEVTGGGTQYLAGLGTSTAHLLLSVQYRTE